MKRGLAFAAGALLLAVALAIEAPATLVDGRVAAATDGRLRIADASGTLWNGAGELVLLPSRARRPVAWHVDAWPLVFGELQGTIAMDAAQPAEFAYGHHSIQLHRLDIALPMDSLLQSAGVPAALATAGGRLEAHIVRLVQTPGALDADLAAQWRDASLPALRPGFRMLLGDVRADARGTGPEIAGSISNVGGDVEIAGRVALSAALVPKIDATIRPRAGIDRDRAETIKTALSLIGSPDGEGGYRLAWPR